MAMAQAVKARGTLGRKGPQDALAAEGGTPGGAAVHLCGAAGSGGAQRETHSLRMWRRRRLW